MTKKLGSKQLLMVTYFLTENKWTTPKELKVFFKDNISNKTITNTLKLNEVQKEVPFSLFNAKFSKRGIIYQLKTDLDTFLLLAEYFLKSEYITKFFESKYTQLILKENQKKLLKKIINNLKLDIDKNSCEKMWDIIIKSPNALKYGLFGEVPSNQMEFYENLFIFMLTDLKNKEFYFPGEFVNEDDFLQVMNVRLEIIEVIGYKGNDKKKEFDLTYYP